MMENSIKPSFSPCSSIQTWVAAATYQRNCIGMGSKVECIPKLDFSNLEPGNTAVWDELQGEVMRALESYGCFEVVYDRVTPELRNELFGRAWPEIFGLPLEVKMLTKSDLSADGYVGQIPGWSYESLLIPDDAEKFANTLWPQGNLTFCDTVSTFIKYMKDLERIIMRMIFLGLGIGKYYDSYTESTIYLTRASEYGTPSDKKSDVILSAHVDHIIVAIIGQNQEGLEIQTKEGEWIPVVPFPNSFTVIIGETVQAWTNGRMQAGVHRVRNTGNGKGKRYSVIFSSAPKDDCIVQTPKELVDEEHPQIYKPYVFMDHKKYRYSDGGDRASKSLSDFCGKRAEEQQT